MNEQIDTERIIDFSVVSIFWELGALSATHVHAGVGGTSQ